MAADAAGSSTDILEISDDNDDDDDDVQQDHSFCNIGESSEDDVMTLDFTLPRSAQRWSLHKDILWVIWISPWF